MSWDVKVSAGRKGGLLGGPNSFQNRKGIHARDETKMRSDSLLGVIDRGDVPWLVERKMGRDLCRYSEIDYLERCVESNYFRHASGKDKGKPNWRSIRFEINTKYHYGENVRSVKALQHKYRKIKQLH